MYLKKQHLRKMFSVHLVNLQLSAADLQSSVTGINTDLISMKSMNKKTQNSWKTRLQN